MKRKIELLAPGGDVDSIKAAIVAGANAIFCGLNRFNARNRAENISFEELNGILRLAHRNGCEVFLTLNIIIVESEIPALITLLNRLVNTPIDGVIIQDLGMFYLLSTYFKGLAIHASTQLTTHNEGQIHFLRKLNATRVNLSRELSLPEIKELTVVAHKENILTEVFVHGSYCLSFSGICYLSSVHGGNSGNRGRCSQPCRNQYLKTETGNDFPLNLKDNSAYGDLRELVDAGVDSLKIEGRIKKFHYVYTVVDAFRKQLQSVYDHDTIHKKNSDLYRVFNRDFSNSFLMGDITEDMFIDNPRDNSALYRSQLYSGSTDENLAQAKRELYNEKTEIRNSVRKKIAPLSIGKVPLQLVVSGKSGDPLHVVVTSPEISFVVVSETPLARINGTSWSDSHISEKNSSGAQSLTYEVLLQRLAAVNATEYVIKHLDVEKLQSALFLPFKELTAMKKQLLFILNGSKEPVASIELPPLKKQVDGSQKPILSLLLSSKTDLYLCDKTSADIHFQLPESFTNNSSGWVELFKNNRRLIPWFPSVLIGGDYHAAVKFLQDVQPEYIVTNNTGVAYAASQMGISWIAGPYLNCVNSYSLLCLKENFTTCRGSFISNEIDRKQIRRIRKPDNFKLYYSIFHPIVLLTSRQCLFQKVTGCEKNRVDSTCIQQCEKRSSITNVKKVSLLLEKTKGNYHTLYNDTHFLNTDIISDIPGVFSNFCIDLRGIHSNTRMESGKHEIVRLFEEHLDGNTEAAENIQHTLRPTTNVQYHKGI